MRGNYLPVKTANSFLISMWEMTRNLCSSEIFHQVPEISFTSQLYDLEAKITAQLSNDQMSDIRLSCVLFSFFLLHYFYFFYFYFTLFLKTLILEIERKGREIKRFVVSLIYALNG